MYQLLTSRNVWIPELVHYKIMMFRVFLSCTHCLRGQTWRYVGNVISRSHFIVLLIVKMIWVASHSVPRRQKGPVEHKHNKKCCDIKTPKSGGKNHISQITNFVWHFSLNDPHAGMWSVHGTLGHLTGCQLQKPGIIHQLWDGRACNENIFKRIPSS